MDFINKCSSNRETKYRDNKKKMKIKMIGLSPNIVIITLTINGLNMATKTQGLAE
jgi:hypothetical protein